MKEFIMAVCLIIGGIVLIALLLALPVMWLWNWLIPEFFGLQTLTFWQALGLSVLARCLFGTGSIKTKSKD